MLALPVGGEAHERGDVGDRALALQGVRGEQVEEHPGPLDVALEDREGAFAGRLGDELVEGVEQAAQLGARRRGELEDRSAGWAASGPGRSRRPARRAVGAGRAVRAGRRHRVERHLARADRLADQLEQVALRAARGPGDREQLERVEAPGARGEGPGEGDVGEGIGERAEGLLEVADLGRREEREPARHGVGDALLAQAGHDRVAVLVLAVEDGERAPRDGGLAADGRVPAGEGADPLDDRGRLVVGAGAGDQLDGEGAVAGAVRREALVGHVAELVAADQAVRDDEDRRAAAEVLDDAQAGRRPGRGAVGVVGRRVGEAAVELDEGGVARAPEAVDRLVVVAHDHHVVGPVGRPPEELDELDLGDVGVLELVDEQVAEAALPAAQDVRALAEEADDGGDLLPEVERAAALPLGLVGAVDERELREPEDLEGGAVGDVGRGEVLGRRALLVGQAPARDGVPGAPDGAAGLAVGDLLDLLDVRVGGRVARGGRPLGGPEGGVCRPRVVAAAVEGAEGLEALERALVGAVASVRRRPARRPRTRRSHPG